jgi:transporter family-2 protein
MALRQKSIQHDKKVQIDRTKIIHMLHDRGARWNFKFIRCGAYTGGREKEIGMPLLVLSCLALVSGALVPLQGGANAALGRALGHPLWAAVASLLVSLICILPVLLAMRVPVPDLGTALAQPSWIWIGGLVGIVYVTGAILLMPTMGAAGFMIAVVAGQLLTSLLIDRFGLMGLAGKPLDLWRVLGAATVMGGVLVFQWPSLSRLMAG